MNLPKIVLYQPEIPQNTGTLIRLSACLGFPLEIIHPCGFVWSDKHLTRAGLDYHELSTVHHHASYEDFCTKILPQNVLLFTPEASQSFYEVEFSPHHLLLFGRESDGFPSSLKATFPHQVAIPMLPQRRSLNLAISVAMAATEALRQLTTKESRYGPLS